MKAKTERELTGRHVLIMLIGFFGIILAINVYFAFAAVKTFRGEDVPRSYRQGLEYNQTIAARATQNKMGWRVRYNTVSLGEGQSDLIIAISDKNGVPISGLSLSGILRHPTDTKRDLAVNLTEEKSGKYKSTLVIPNGQWTLMAAARNAQQSFDFQYDLWVK